jgi:hypothetical protein
MGVFSDVFSDEEERENNFGSQKDIVRNLRFLTNY